MEPGHISASRDMPVKPPHPTGDISPQLHSEIFSARREPERNWHVAQNEGVLRMLSQLRLPGCHIMQNVCLRIFEIRQRLKSANSATNKTVLLMLVFKKMPYILLLKQTTKTLIIDVRSRRLIDATILIAYMKNDQALRREQCTFSEDLRFIFHGTKYSVSKPSRSALGQIPCKVNVFDNINNFYTDKNEPRMRKTMGTYSFCCFPGLLALQNRMFIPWAESN